MMNHGTLAVYLCILNSKVFYCSDDLNYITYYYLFIYYYTYLHLLKLRTIETSWAVIFIVRPHVVLELYVIRPKLTSLRVVFKLLSLLANIDIYAPRCVLSGIFWYCIFPTSHNTLFSIEHLITLHRHH